MDKNWSLLPPKALRTIFSYFKNEELVKIACVCKNWLEIIQDPGGMEDNDNFMDMDGFEEVEESEEETVIEIPIKIPVVEKKPETEEEKRIRLLNSVKNVVKNLENRDPSTLTADQKQKLASAKASLEILKNRTGGSNSSATKNIVPSSPKWKNLPPKALETIFSYLSIQEIMKISEVYKPWYDQFNQFLELESGNKSNVDVKKVGQKVALAKVGSENSGDSSEIKGQVKSMASSPEIPTNIGHQIENTEQGKVPESKTGTAVTSSTITKQMTQNKTVTPSAVKQVTPAKVVAKGNPQTTTSEIPVKENAVAQNKIVSTPETVAKISKAVEQGNVSSTTSQENSSTPVSDTTTQTKAVTKGNPNATCSVNGKVTQGKEVSVEANASNPTKVETTKNNLPKPTSDNTATKPIVQDNSQAKTSESSLAPPGPRRSLRNEQNAKTPEPSRIMTRRSTISTSNQNKETVTVSKTSDQKAPTAAPRITTRRSTLIKEITKKPEQAKKVNDIPQQVTIQKPQEKKTAALAPKATVPATKVVEEKKAVAQNAKPPVAANVKASEAPKATNTPQKIVEAKKTVVQTAKSSAKGGEQQKTVAQATKPSEVPKTLVAASKVTEQKKIVAPAAKPSEAPKAINTPQKVVEQKKTVAQSAKLSEAVKAGEQQKTFAQATKPSEVPKTPIATSKATEQKKTVSPAPKAAVTTQKIVEPKKTINQSAKVTEQGKTTFPSAKPSEAPKVPVTTQKAVEPKKTVVQPAKPSEVSPAANPSEVSKLPVTSQKKTTAAAVKPSETLKSTEQKKTTVPVAKPSQPKAAVTQTKPTNASQKNITVQPKTTPVAKPSTTEKVPTSEEVEEIAVKIKQEPDSEKDKNLYSAWSKIVPKVLKTIVSFLSLEESKKLRIVCKDWRDSLEREDDGDDSDVEVMEVPPVVIDLADVEDEEERTLDKALLVTVIDRCSSEPTVTDKDWDRLEDRLTKWILENKNRQAPRFEKLEKYKGHRILKCLDSETKIALKDIVNACNNSWKGATFEVVTKDEIPRKGPSYSIREINKSLIQAKTTLLRYRRQNPKNMDFFDFCEVSKAWETIDRYEVQEEKLALYKKVGVEENPRKHPRQPLKKLELTDLQLDSVVDYYPETKKVMFLMDKLKRKKVLSDEDYDTRKFGAEWLLPYKQRILDKEAKKELEKNNDKSTSKKDDKNTSSSSRHSDKSSSSSKRRRSSSRKRDRSSSLRKDGSSLRKERSPSKRSNRSPSKRSDRDRSSLKRDRSPSRNERPPAKRRPKEGDQRPLVQKEKSMSVRKAPVDWALELPEKFMSRLVVHLSNKSLGSFSRVCKRWHKGAATLLRRRYLYAREAAIQDFRLSRKIYDAKRKIKAFIKRNPNTMNSAQKADLARSKQLLQNENLFDLDIIMNYPIVMPILKRSAIDVLDPTPPAKIQVMDVTASSHVKATPGSTVKPSSTSTVKTNPPVKQIPTIPAVPTRVEPTMQQIPIRNPYPPQNIFPPRPINQFIRPGLQPMVMPQPQPMVRPQPQPMVRPAPPMMRQANPMMRPVHQQQMVRPVHHVPLPMNHPIMQYPMVPPNAVLQGGPVAYPVRSRWGQEAPRMPVVQPPQAVRPTPPVQSPFLVSIQTNDNTSEEKTKTQEAAFKIKVAQKPAIVPPPPAFKTDYKIKDDLWTQEKDQDFPPPPSFRKSETQSTSSSGFNRQHLSGSFEEAPPPPKISSSRFEVPLVAKSRKFDPVPPPPKLSSSGRFDVQPDTLQSNRYDHREDTQANRFDPQRSNYSAIPHFDLSANTSSYDPSQRTSKGFDLSTPFDPSQRTSKGFDLSAPFDPSQRTSKRFDLSAPFDPSQSTSKGFDFSAPFDPSQSTSKGFDFSAPFDPSQSTSKGFDFSAPFDPSQSTSKGFDFSAPFDPSQRTSKGFDLSASLDSQRTSKGFDLSSHFDPSPRTSKGFDLSAPSDSRGSDKPKSKESKTPQEAPQQTLSSTLEAVRKRLQQQMKQVEEPVRKRPYQEEERSYPEQIEERVRKEDLRVAIIDQNAINGSISNEKWDEVRSRLNRAIMQRSMQHPNDPGPVFSYLGLHMDKHWYQCENEFSLSFLKETVSWMGSLWPNAKLKVEEVKNILDRPQAKVWIPDPTLDLTQIMAILLCQNSMIAKSDLVVVGVDGNKSRTGQCIILEMTKTAEEYIRRTGGMINFGVDQIIVRFSNTNVQEVSSSKQSQPSGKGFWD